MYVSDDPVLKFKDKADKEITSIDFGDLTAAEYEAISNGYDEITLEQTNISRTYIVDDQGCVYADLYKTADGETNLLFQVHVGNSGRKGVISFLSVGTNGKSIVTDLPVSFGKVTSTVTDKRDNKVYSVALMNDGLWWMTQGLAYVPEGITVSETPTSGKIWYPSSSEKVADKSAEAIATIGYYYDIETLLDATLDESNYTNFSYNHQGLCPEGYFIPSVDDYAYLITLDSYHKSGSTQSANNYNAGSANKASLIADGFTFGTTGMIQKNTGTAEAKYAFVTNSCFWWTSTGKTWGDGVTTGQTSSYFYGAMAMGTDTAGTIMVAQNSRFAGYSVRCVSR